MTYLAVAPLVLAKDQAGRIHYHYESVNPVIPWLSDEQAEHFLAEGLVVKVKAADSPYEVEFGDGAGDPNAVALVKPPHAATKGLWVAYVVARTADSSQPVTEPEAEKLTKQELIDLYGE